MIRILQCISHLSGVILLVRLRTQGMDGRPLRFIQHFRLNKGLVNILPHLSAQGIQLSHQMALGASSYIRITGHQRNAVHADCKHDGFKAQSGCRQRRLTAGVPGSNHHNVI